MTHSYAFYSNAQRHGPYSRQVESARTSSDRMVRPMINRHHEAALDPHLAAGLKIIAQAQSRRGYIAI